MLNQNAIIDQKLSMEAFQHISGKMAGYPFIKFAFDRKKKSLHFINNHLYTLHAKYIATNILNIDEDQLIKNIDELNQTFYYGSERPFYLGILSIVNNETKPFFVLESVEVDDMKAPMISDFYQLIKNNIPSHIPLYFKPANFDQEHELAEINDPNFRSISMHELMLNKNYIPLNEGKAKGRLRVFRTFEDYIERKNTLRWFDILIMNKIPEDVPRLSGFINSAHTAPLSHTNVLASGWQIPNSIQLGVMDDVVSKGLTDKWVSYEVKKDFDSILLKEIEPVKRKELKNPKWMAHRVQIEAPSIDHIPTKPLKDLRKSDGIRYGTKAANIGELFYIKNNPGHRLSGYYQVPRYPRNNLLSYLAKLIGSEVSDSLHSDVHRFFDENTTVPRGIAIPFSLQQRFLQTSPQIQQTIGKLKMALELEAKQIDSLCIELQRKIRSTPFPDYVWEEIDQNIARYMSGCKKFVIRSSSNAEDLKNFSAAGIYESFNHQSSSQEILDSIKNVWASLVSPRSMRMRHEVGIGLDECFMGVIIQEEVPFDFGGVMVTMNPLATQNDYRNVYINASSKGATDVVAGGENGLQFLFNIVEGGGRTLAKESNAQHISKEKMKKFQNLAVIGKLLQSHFSPDYTYEQPMDIEWAIKDEQIFLLQIRPYAHG